MSLQVQEVQEPVRIGKVLDRLMISNFFFCYRISFLKWLHKSPIEPTYLMGCIS